MSIIQQAVASAEETQVVPEAEYELEVLSGEYVEKSKSSGNPMVVALIKVTNPPDGITPDLIRHYISLVNQDDDEDQKAQKLRQQRRFLECFGIPFTDEGYDTEDFSSATGMAFVKLNEGDDGVVRNVVVPPKFEGEGDNGGSKPKGRKRG